MIIGPCPYCDETQFNAMSKAGKFVKPTCKDCGKEYWLYMSHFDSKAYNLEHFEIGKDIFFYGRLEESEVN